MSVASEITRLQTAKADLKTAIEAKGVTVSSSATLDDYATLVSSIQTGGGDLETALQGMTDCTTEFALPSSIEVDASKAYVMQYRKVTNCTIKSGITEIATYAFNGCSKLTSITIPDSVTTIKSNAFNNCSALTSIDLGSGVKKIEGYSFNGCKFTTLELPASVNNILGEGCRVGATLREVIVNATEPPTAGTNIFSGCTNLASIYVPDGTVATYQGTSGWSTYSSKIKSINERPTT